MMKCLPNLITILRMLLLLPYIYFLYLGSTKIAFILFIIAGFTDCLDGFLARYFSWTSKLGAILDPLADKLLMVSSFVVLYLIGSLNIFVLLIFVFRDLYIIFGALYVSYKKPDTIEFEALFISKINTFFQLFLIFCLLLNLSYLPVPSALIHSVIFIVIITSVVSLVQYIQLGRKWLAMGSKI